MYLFGRRTSVGGRNVDEKSVTLGFKNLHSGCIFLCKSLPPAWASCEMEYLQLTLGLLEGQETRNMHLSLTGQWMVANIIIPLFSRNFYSSTSLLLSLSFFTLFIIHTSVLFSFLNWPYCLCFFSRTFSFSSCLFFKIITSLQCFPFHYQATMYYLRTTLKIWTSKNRALNMFQWYNRGLASVLETT